jgi:hypothetical protein
LTLIDKTREWLESQGFPLEMRTAAEFQKAAFGVKQSGFYVDPDTKKNREIDVEAWLPNFLGLVSVGFIVECKATTKPWVLLSSQDTVSDYGRHYALAEMTTTARQLLQKRFEDFDRIVRKIPWLKKDGLIGYSLRQAHSDKDSGYEAAISIAKACMARVRDFEKEKYVGQPKRIAFVFPVIVTNAPLIQCSIAEDGHLALKEVEQGEFLFLDNGFGACIRVVTANHLPVFVQEAKNIGEEIQKEFKSEGEETVQRMEHPGRHRFRLEDE